MVVAKKKTPDARKQKRKRQSLADNEERRLERIESSTRKKSKSMKDAAEQDQTKAKKVTVRKEAKLKSAPKKKSAAGQAKTAAVSKTTESKSMEDAAEQYQPSEYENLRLEKIRRNKKRLDSLGLSKGLLGNVHKPAPKKKTTVIKHKVPSLPQRDRSSRPASKKAASQISRTKKDWAEKKAKSDDDASILSSEPSREEEEDGHISSVSTTANKKKKSAVGQAKKPTFYTPSGRCVSKQRPSKQRPGHPTESRKVFYTSNGRRINDRRGIQVDVRTPAQRSLLNDLLSSTGAYYQFASEWYAKNPSAQFDGTNDKIDKIYKDFRAFVSREQQRGHLKLEETFDNKRMLQQIELISNASNNRKSSLQSVARLKHQIAKDLLSEFDSPKCRDIIRSELELNLLARVSPDSLLIERSSKTDGLVKEAVKILKSSNSYDTILNKS
ncbi:hypothetical protein ACHAWC_008600 [Mediolabrus comicus]